MIQIKKLFLTLSTLFLLVVLLQPSSTHAVSKTEATVTNAEKAASTLYNLSYLPGKATGKNLPEKEYKAANSKYTTAQKEVKKLSNGKAKTKYNDRLKKVKTKIDTGKTYITAVKAGKEIDNKRVALEKALKTGPYTESAHNAYLSLTATFGKQASKVAKVKGTKTKEKMTSLYINPVEKHKSQLKTVSAVKQAISETKNNMNASSEKILPHYKSVILHIDTIPNAEQKAQLKKEFAAIQKKLANKELPKKDKLGEWVALQTNYDQLDGLISPGKSDAMVPTFHKTINTKISSLPSTEKNLLEQKLTTIMSDMFLSTKELKTLLTKKAIEKNIPPEVVKAIAKTENGQWHQFTNDGEAFESSDGGYGIMQITPQSKEDKSYEWDKVKYDSEYNIQAGVEILLKKWDYANAKKPVLPKVNEYNTEILENWYFAIMAYNGLSERNHPAAKAPYQAKVYQLISGQAFVNPYVFNKNDVKIEIKDNSILSFQNKMSYQTPKQTQSTQLYKKGTSLTLNKDTSFRNEPSTTSSKKQIFKKGTNFKIVESSIEDNNAANLFNWYKIQASGSKTIWYVASSNVQ
ncbi:transglycosylase SLT domain-containing protein [Peribacillus sp. NPDC097295]|uniref:transglycosylase SLT domain-containing protein n=1 Tax=Peribacillus sp. NPDC097295 TaxID=3364402 RepID=UPI003815B06A